MLGSFPLTLVGCTTHDAFRIAQSVAGGRSLEDIAVSRAQSKARSWVTSPQSLVNDIKRVDSFLTHISSAWGGDDSVKPSPKEYVKYTDGYTSRALVNFETGIVRVESQNKQHLKQLIINTLLTPANPEKVDLFSDQEVVLGDEPFLFNQIVDQDNKPIRWAWRAGRYAAYLLNQGVHTRQIKISDGSQQSVSYVEFPLLQQHKRTRQYKYASYVERYAAKYQLAPALVYAIIETESNFNPYAVSWVPAYGLMQIVPTTAGRDAFEEIHGYAGTPSAPYLFNIENNIRMGCAYLHILKNRYLAKVRHPISKEYCVIAAYNGGAGNVLRSFSSQREEAFRVINTASSDNVWSILGKKMPKESQRYLVKVTEAKKRY
ncbi:murein transglycosylase domain-containing protein [Neptuniibacter marinus]|uniref:murein transglycosylase domain-containing protein n=1 Tax=Neptuniibacter marinus TaxID=1806670 RepID=UPI0018D4172A|nr:murein transglycosylase domain-containing protein [Neptuniibacter marinus]